MYIPLLTFNVYYIFDSLKGKKIEDMNQQFYLVSSNSLNTLAVYK